MSQEETIADIILEDNPPLQVVRELCCEHYIMFTRLSDGRQRFSFEDSSYIDIYPATS